MTFFIILAFVLIGSTAILLYQWWTRMLTPEERRIRSLKPLSHGRRPNDG